MVNRPSDVERIQSGEGSKFNSAQADLERMHWLIQSANEARVRKDFELWLSILQALDAELSPYYNEADELKVNAVRVSTLPRSSGALFLISKKLNEYERELRAIRGRKKLGIIADDDLGSAMFD